MLLLFAAQAWWVSFGLEDKAEWRFDTFLVILLQMGLIYMLAALILPDAPEGAPIDLTAHFETQRRPFFACLLLVIAVSLLKDLMLEGELPEPLNLAFHGVLIVIAVLGLAMRRTSFRLALALFTALTFVLYVGALFARL